jgi:DNA-binding MarR family transcriptional regulator
MKKPPYDHRDRILWILAQKGGSITRTELCRSIEIKQENMERILGELEKEGRIKRTVDKYGELITLEV